MGKTESVYRILVAEDDAVLADGICGVLRAEGHAVHCVTDGVHAFDALDHESYDLLVLDLGLPRMDGLELLRRIRAASNEIPVMVVSARGEVDSRVTGLKAGADDYLSKPFALAEFEARIESLLKRRGSAAPAGGTRTSRDPDGQGDLTPRETEILAALKNSEGRAVSIEQLIRCITTEGETMTENGIQVCVSRLRRKLAGSGLTIRTARGLGYVISKSAPPAGDDGGNT